MVVIFFFGFCDFFFARWVFVMQWNKRSEKKLLVLLFVDVFVPCDISIETERSVVIETETPRGRPTKQSQLEVSK